MPPHHINGNIDSFNITDSFNKVWNNCIIADEDEEIMAWLSPLEPQIRHQDIRTRRVSQVGSWLLKTKEYRNWSSGIPRGGHNNGSALFWYGDPGVGKTYISSQVIDSLCEQAMEGNTGVACFYFDFAVKEEQSLEAILGSVLKQVVGGLDEVPEKIVKAFRSRRKVIGGKRLQLDEIVGFLQDMTSARRTFICIDALDEYPAEHRRKLLDLLNQVLQNAPGARLFLTGRSFIRDEVGEYLEERVVIRLITPTKNDIITFLRAKLREDTMPHEMDKKLEGEIIKYIPKTVSKIFLLAFLSIETILQETTIYRRRQRLRRMERGLDLGGAYGAMVGRVKAQGEERARLGMAVLMWIFHSRRPLQVDEIGNALAIRRGSNDLHNDEISAISTWLSCCQGLVTVDKRASTVRLIHFSLQEYLGTHPEFFDKAHSTMAETCLTYLNFKSVKDFSADSSPDPRDTPFLEYSSLYWGTHMRMELSDRAKTCALQLLCEWDSHTSAKYLWESAIERLPSYYHPTHKPFPPLHCISYFGISGVVDTLIQMNRWDVNQRDSAGMTPLIWAASCGREEVVRLLLGQGRIKPNKRDRDGGRTALSWAAGNGHEGVVRLFLGPQFLNLGSIGRLWGAPQVARQLFGRRYVNLDTQDTRYGKTPLSWAAENGHEPIVKLLLERGDVDPDSSSLDGRTPLAWAAENGHGGIVELLLGRGEVNPNNSDTDYGQTPLLSAAEKGHEGVVKLLLGRKDVNPNTPDTDHGLTPLSWATEMGHEGIVKLLLAREDLNPDVPAMWSGKTPLLSAVEHGHDGIVKLLLGREDVNPNTPDRDNDRTPISWAAGNGHEGIVKLLLEQEGINPDTPAWWNGKTPLWYAAENGHEGIVKLLLGREDVNPDVPARGNDKTPLWRAAENGHEGIVKLLLWREDVNPNSREKYGQTTLLLAAEHGYEGIVELLLQRKDINLEASARWNGKTSLSWAAEHGHEGILKLLLGRKDINPNTPDTKDGRTPLSFAAENGHEGIVKLLLGLKDVIPDTPCTWHGQTPLSWAAEKGREGIVKLLLGRKDVNPDSSSNSGHTPLSLAAENGHEGIVKLLLKRKEVNPNCFSKSGETPLQLATKYRHYRVVKLLQDLHPSSIL